jgi:RNA recognition motif-containing protein
MASEDNNVPASAGAEEPVASPSTETKSKRKADVEEIEVNLEAPEPPSKRAKRALKKGKALPKKADSDNDDDLTKDNADAGKNKARGEHGVWIGNLPFTVSAEQLKTWLVNNSGGVITDEAITRIKLPKSKESARDKNAKPTNKGFAYVDFNDIGGKVAAIALSELDLGARKLLIKDSKSFEGRPKKAEELEEADEDGLQEQKQAFKKEQEASRKIFVGNMSFKTTEEDVRRNFEKCGEIEFVKVAQFEDTGKCKGFGWVRFKEPEAAAWAVKGFVKLKEEIETEEDFKEGGSGSDESDTEEAKPRQKQFKTRKWWVNRLLGRELKLELAEDDKVRYQKRFGKGAQNRTDGAGRNDAPAKKAPAKASSGMDLQTARMTGAAVKATGTKVTFD